MLNSILDCMQTCADVLTRSGEAYAVLLPRLYTDIIKRTSSNDTRIRKAQVVLGTSYTPSHTTHSQLDKVPFDH